MSETPEQFSGTGPVSDPTNVQFDVVEDTLYDVPLGYALLADVQEPPVIRGDDLEDLGPSA